MPCKAGNQAFTLVEVLIVVIVLAILAAIAVPTFAGMAAESRMTTLSSNLATMRRQLEADRVLLGAWPLEGEVAWADDLPDNPLHPHAGTHDRAREIQFATTSNPDKKNPGSWNLAEIPNRRGYWYNATNGAAMGRTLPVGKLTAAEVFERVNGYAPEG